jgi:kynurenine formamidase
MIFIDLSHEIFDGMPVFPTDIQVSLKQTHKVATDGYSNFRIMSGLHIGTHIDSPAHFISDGERIHQISPERFCGRAIVLDARSAESLYMNILPENGIDEDLIVIICTGHYKNFKSDNYYKDYPVLSPEICEYFISRKVKMVALDTPSPDKSPYEIHDILLGAGILIAENLTNTEQLLNIDDIMLYAFPLKIQADGSPSRIIAVINNIS